MSMAGNSKVALVLAGGFDQIALIDELKGRGYSVLLADYLENPPAAPFADEHIRVSTLDEAAILELAKNRNVCLVTTACTDQALLTVAIVSETLGLPCYLSASTARKVTDKTLMKKIMAESGIPTSSHIVIGQSEVSSFLSKRDHVFPLVVKPCDCNSSKGVVKVLDKESLASSLKQALNLSRSGKAIVEGFVSGREISLDIWLHRGEATLIGASESVKKSSNGSFTIVQSKSVLTTERMVNRFEELGVAIANAFGLSEGPLLVQTICDGESISVIEFSARMGGGTKYRLIEAMSGIDIMARYVDFIHGEELESMHPCRPFRLAEINYLYANDGRFSQLAGFDSAVNAGLITEYYLYKRPGSFIDSRLTSGDRVAGFLIVGDSTEDIEGKREAALCSIDVIDEQGGSMLCREML